MDLTTGPEYEEFRRQVRSFLEQHREQAPPAGPAAGSDPRVRSWQKMLIENGYAARTVPRDYGGYGAPADLLETIIIDEEFSRAKLFRGMENQGISMFVPTVLHYGSHEQKQSYVGPTMQGEMIWCQGYSEPSAGSDLASLRTQGRLDGDDWVINGQKIWTSTANEADMMFCLVRTEPEAKKHAGISYILIDMNTPGLDVRPLKTMTGDSTFNEVFFTDVRVPRENLVGERGQGWEIATYLLRFERNMLGRSGQTESFLQGCTQILRETGAIEEPVFRDRLMSLVGRSQAMKYHGLRMLTDRLKSRDSGASSLITKLNGCQLNYDLCALAIDAMGEYGVLQRGSRHVRDGGAWQIQYMYALGLIIGGGTAQIQKNIISEAGLGMPREPKAGG
jgi:alkylation response protein AidB-like acyl-CoA dehydrogenase